MVQSALGQRLRLAGLILSSSLPYPTGPVETIPPDTWNDALQSAVLGPISLVQSFLPLVWNPADSFNRIVAYPASIQNHFPVPFCYSIVTPPIPRPSCCHPLRFVFHSAHFESRTAHHPSHPTQLGDIRLDKVCHPAQSPDHNTRTRDRLMAKSTTWSLRQSIPESSRSSEKTSSRRECARITQYGI